MRKAQLERESCCVMCRDTFGRTRPATVADHIIPHRGDLALFYDTNNLQSLCAECHSKHKQREELGLLPKHEFDASGYPV